MTRILLIVTLILSLASPAQAIETSVIDEAVYRISLGSVNDAILLVKKLGNPNMVDKTGWPLLAIAAARTDDKALEMTRALVRLGADVNFDGGTRNYPLMYAIQSGNPDVVEYLLDQGANYRAVDAYGMRVVDFARQSGNKEIIRFIEDAIDTDILGLAKVRSQKYLDELIFKLAWNSCALQYYSYYFSSKQDPIPEDEKRETLNKYNRIVNSSMSQLASLFKIKPGAIADINERGKQKMYAEMEKMVSNRWRRSKGVGQPGDMDKRCDTHSEEFKAGIFNKEKLEADFLKMD